MLIDLSVPINDKTPVYPGDPSTNIKPAGALEKDGFNDHYVSIGTHVGTHIDAPLHMIEGGKTLNEFPIERFVSRGVCIEVFDREFDFGAVKNTDIRDGDAVLFHTGLIDEYHNSAYFEDYPAIPEDIANFLVERKVNMVGVDMCSPDHPPFPIHKKLLGGDVLIVENLQNLNRLIGKEFKVYALPLNLEIDGAPARVVAEVL